VRLAAPTGSSGEPRIAPVDANLAAAVALIGALGGALGSVLRSWLARPKTRAEADKLNAAATVSISADARQWASTFAERADRAERRADQAEHRADEAEHRADEAEHRADQAEDRARQAEVKADNVETNLIRTYSYVRQLRETIVRLHGTPPAPPPELEALWRDALDT
jgi:methyl-accepting chemotaxis protein